MDPDHRESHDEMEQDESVSRGLRALGKLIRESAPNDGEPIHATLGRYKVYRQLGQGGQSRAYLAHDPTLAREVVLKVYHSVPDAEIRSREQLVEEGRALCSIKSPFVATCYGIEFIEADEFLVLEYVEGQSLRTELDRRTMAPAEAMKLVADIAEGLSEIHQARVVHGDVKPANIIIAADGTPKLIDFGIARASSSSDAPLQLGTAAYMAPERLEHPNELDHRSDLFSLGVICFQLLTGSSPFPTDSKTETLRRIYQNDIPREKLYSQPVPSWMQTVCLDLLAESPADRPQSAKQLSDEIRGRLRPPVSSRKLLMACAAILAVLMFAVSRIRRAPVSSESSPTRAVSDDSEAESIAIDTDLAAIGEGIRARKPVYELQLKNDIPMALELEKAVMDGDGYYMLDDKRVATVELRCGLRCFIAIYNIEIQPGDNSIKCELIHPHPDAARTGAYQHEPYQLLSFDIVAENDGATNFLYAVASHKPWDPTALVCLHMQRSANKLARLRSEWRSIRRTRALGECVLPIQVTDFDDIDVVALQAELDEARALAQTEELSGNLARAIDLREQTLSILQQIDPSSTIQCADELAALARLRKLNGDYRASEFLLKHATRCYDVDKRRADDAQLALSELKTVLSLSDAGVARWKEANELLDAAWRARDAEDWPDLERDSTACLEIFNELDSNGLRPHKAAAHFLLGVSALQNQQPEKAQFHMRKCKAHVETTNVGVDYWMKRIGSEFLAVGLQQEGRHWSEFSSTHHRGGDESLERELAQITTEMSAGQAQAALDEVSERVGSDDENLARVYEVRGQVAVENGSLYTAYNWFDRSLSLYQRALGENTLESARVNVEIACILRDLGFYVKQSRHCESALIYLRDRRHLFPEVYAIAVGQRGLHDRDNWRQPDFGESSLKKAIELFPGDASSSRQYATILLGLADLYLWQNRLDEAEQLFEKYRREAGRRGLDTQPVDIGLSNVAYAQGDSTRASELLEKVLHDRCLALELFRREGRMEESRRLLYVTWNTLGNLISVTDMTEPSEQERVYRWIHRIRSTTYPTDFRGATEGELAQLNRQFSELSSQISRLAVTPDLRLHVPELYDLLSSRIEIDGKRHQLVESASPPDLDETLRDLPEHTALVDIVTFALPPRDRPIRGRPQSDLKVYAFVSQNAKDSIETSCVQIGNYREIEPAVARWISDHSSDRGRGVRPVAGPVVQKTNPQADLFDLIWRKIEPLAGNCSTVISLRSGVFDQLPLGALRNPENQRYLIEDYRFVQLSTITDLTRMREPPWSRGERLLAVGGLSFGTSSAQQRRRFQWPELPESQQEIDQLASLFEGDSILLSHQSASKQNVIAELSRCGSAHFATHGKFLGVELYALRKDERFYVDMRNMQVLGFLESTGNLLHFLALSNANVATSQTPVDDLGLLSALEIAELDLSNLGLVTLSACSSGVHQRGRGYSTDSGLPNAFLRAGARSVVGSLWLVEDHATRALMSEFYRNHWQHGLSVGESLRQAKISLLRGDLVASESGEIPVGWWAPWVVTGDWR